MDEISAESQQSSQIAMQTPDTASKAIEDGADITKRRIMNDYSSYKPISIETGKEQIRLLQVLPPKDDDDEDEELVCILADAPADTGRIVYIALSYCWGDMSQQRKISLIHHSFNESEDSIVEKNEDGTTLFAVDTAAKKTFNVTETLYKALKSLRKSGPQLKERFSLLDHQPLWVDALCINQSDIKERNSQVGIMRSIYSKAMFVFIWMGEEKDVMRGLNMIVGIIRILREQYGDAFDILKPNDEQLKTLLVNIGYDFGDENLGPEGCLQVLQRFFNNQYFQRIWVLQEASCNAESTFLYATNIQVPFSYVLVAERCCQLRNTMYFTGQQGVLPAVWGGLLRQRLIHVREAHKENKEGGGSPHDVEKCNVLGSLYALFEHTCNQFEATDPRDKLYALLDFAHETQRGTKAREELAPDYNKPVSEVFTNFTVWCIRHSGSLDVLGLLCSGPRRVLPEDLAKFGTEDSPPKFCLDVRSHPSWALWPTKGGIWTQGSLVEMAKAAPFDLATQQTIRLFNLATHPQIRLPKNLTHRFLSLGGKRIGAVKSSMRMPLKCIQQATDENSFLKKVWATDALKQDMEKYPSSYTTALTHPYHDMVLNGGLTHLWLMVKEARSPAIFFHEEVVEAVEAQEWLGREGGRYQGKEELMFRDFLETLLLSPVYRGENSLDYHDDGIPDGPWNDETIATSFALFWAENDPRFMYSPPRIGELLKVEMFVRGISQTKLFPFLCGGVGKCFFITEDERMGMCPPDTRPGDIIVALFGSRVPFVVRPVRKETKFEGDEWTFEGSEMLKDQLYRFVGECYVHERMTSSFLRDQAMKLGEAEVFNLC
ncbi:heterokaryon incompatibility protein-domain-containing protein [Ilyonectria sp. MPI-CAGE-AT-0026]|nr:heterokaryon incompatibility protein-domain-containing protein [Ilyonectria sp. MPI-CAGE-AT-0026]